MPESFEVLDGMFPCTTQRLHTFLERVGVFPTSKFVVLNVQDLPGELQEYLVNFMSHSELSEKDQNFHCIQLSDTILHSSPWVEKLVWNERKLHRADLKKFKYHIVDGFFIKQVIVVLGESGSGKTRWIRNEIKSLQDKNESMQTLSLPIHEGTTVHSLVESLKSIQFCESHRSAIHFSFMVPLDASCDTGWMKSLNHFFNMLLLTRSVHDSVTGETYFLGWQRCIIYVELQGIDVNSNRHVSSSVVEKALAISIPILTYCSTFQTPPQNYKIDDEAMRVSTYLRALKDGTIDRKFDPTRNQKQLMFVIDVSGSMGGAYHNAAINNALSIFDSHIHIGDVSISLVS